MRTFLDIVRPFSFFLIVLLLAAVAFDDVQAGAPGPTELNGQKVLTLVNREPPGLRCNNNMQVAAELSNLFKIPVMIIPKSLAGPDAKAPAVYYGGAMIAVDGGEKNGMVSFTQIADVVDIENALTQDEEGHLMKKAIKKQFDVLKGTIKEVR